MTRHSAPTPKSGVACSACGAVVRINPALRWTKMQCPKCRAVTTLPTARAEEPIPKESHQEKTTDEAPSERSEAARLEARLSTLEARLALVEKELRNRAGTAEAEAEDSRRSPDGASHELAPGATVSVHGAAETAEAQSRRRGIRGAAIARETNRSEALPARQPPGASFHDGIGMTQPCQTVCRLPEQGLLSEQARGKFPEMAKWLGETDEAPESFRASDPAEPALVPPNEPFTAPPEDGMLQKLAEITAGEVAIRVKEGDTEAILFGEWLGLVFIKAGWSVPTFEARQFSPDDQNLTLSVSRNFPFPKKVSAIHSALAAAGLGLTFGIDPTSDSPIPTLMVPRRPMEKIHLAEGGRQPSPNTGLVGSGSPPGDS